MKTLIPIIFLMILVSCGNSIDMSMGPSSVTTSSSIASWQAGNKIGFPLSFGDQNFPTASVQTGNGDVYVTSIVGDSPGWERWVVYRSTDNGANFTRVDHYDPYEDGESHPLSMVAKGNDVYTCGYQWGPSNVEWVIRKTSNGTSWSNVDFLTAPGNDLVCYDLDKSAGGNLYAVGYDTSVGGIIRESTDNGVTWNTIFSTAAVTQFTAVRVSPAGAVWALGQDGKVFRGTFAAGWTFNHQGTASFSPFGPYEMRGDLEILSETNALLSYQGASWMIERTTDTGATWTTTYTGAANSEGHGVRQLNGGEIIAVGSVSWPFPRTALIEKSTDNGVTWTNVYTDNTDSQQAVSVIELADGNVRVFGQYYDGSRQIFNLLSTDAGDTWTLGNEIRYFEKLYHDFSDYVVDGNGNFWAAGYVGFVDSNNQEAWAVVKSSDQGATWTDSDVFTDPLTYLFTESLAVGPSNEIYAAGGDGSGDYIVRKTSDAGATWNEVDRSSDRARKMTVAGNGDVFTIGDSAGGWLRKGAVNGTVWSQILSFPIEPAATNFFPTGLKAFSDGSLWLGGRQKDGGVTDEMVVYRSTNGGASFTEVLTVSGVSGGQSLTFRNGSVFVIAGDFIKRSDDDGATWIDVYDGTILGTPFDFAIASDGRLFVMNGSNEILQQTSVTGGYVLSLDYGVFNSNSTAWIERFVDCGSSTGICTLGHFDVSVEGSVYQFIKFDY